MKPETSLSEHFFSFSTNVCKVLDKACSLDNAIFLSLHLGMLPSVTIPFPLSLLPLSVCCFSVSCWPFVLLGHQNAGTIGSVPSSVFSLQTSFLRGLWIPKLISSIHKSFQTKSNTQSASEIQVCITTAC